MTHWLTLLGTTAAFACLACAMDRTQTALFRHPLGMRPSRWFRVSGWLLLVGSLWGSVPGPAWSLGLVAWVGFVCVGAALVYLGLMGWNAQRFGRK